MPAPASSALNNQTWAGLLATYRPRAIAQPRSHCSVASPRFGGDIVPIIDPAIKEQYCAEIDHLMSHLAEFKALFME